MTAPTWSNERRKLSALIPWPRNPRKIEGESVRRLQESFEEFGQPEVIAISPSNEVYNGHQRLKSWFAKFGDIEVDVRVSSRPLTEKERERLTVLLHRGAVGEWDFETLANEFEVGELLEWGFTEMELGLDAPVGNADAEPQIDRAEELRQKWGVEPGQLWRIGEHRLICGDCTDAATVARVMGGEKARMVIADPPYGVSIVAANVSVGGGEGPDGMIPFGGVKNKKGYVGGGEGDSLRHGHYAIEEHGKAKRLGGSVGAAKPFGSKNVRGTVGASNIVEVGKYAPIIGDDTIDTAVNASRYYLDLYPDAVQVWFGANYYAHQLEPSPCWVVWDKEMTGNFADCELAWCNQKRPAKLFRHRWNGMVRDSERERRWHPTQKPAALAAWIMMELGEAGDIVLDPFAGAGWTMIAAQNSGRICRAIEMSVDYLPVILERMATAFPGIVIERVGE